MKTEKNEKISVSTNWLGGFLCSYTEIIFGSANIQVRYKSGKCAKLCTYEQLTSPPHFRAGLISGSLQVEIGGNLKKFNLLRTTEIKEKYQEIAALCLPHIAETVDNIYRYFCERAIAQYLRDSDIESLTNRAYPWVKILSSPTVKHVEAETKAQLEFLNQYVPVDKYAARLRETYEQNALKNYALFFDNAESNPLTQNQRLSVVRNNDYNLVLAAAGTGKTSVMVAKALDLIKHHNVLPEEVLVLAYNKAAADELRERFSRRGDLLGIHQTPSISTFHALGRSILKRANKPVHLTKFTEDSRKLNQWVTYWLGRQLEKNIGILQNILMMIYQPVNPFNFKTESEYQAYVRDNEYRTLSGDRVRGFQELLIANWLFANGIKFEYEPVYISKRRIEEGVDYKPDFYLVDADIYLEHFGIDRHGKTRPDIDSEKYNHEILLKRKLHQEHNTKLIETYHYNWLEGALEERLSELMIENNVTLKPLAGEKLLEALNSSGLESDIAEVLFKSLQAMRSEDLKELETIERLKEAEVHLAEWIASFLNKLHLDYQEELRQQNAIDFDDMILLARDLIKTKQVKPTWKHILVDEFQDISNARLKLIKAFIEFGNSPTLTAVGDDWQSIYRFSGGKLEITTRFEEYLGKRTLTTLDKTFRYNSSIAHTAGTFVMENPEQYKKDVQTQVVAKTPQVFLLDTIVEKKSDPDERISQVVQTIRKNDPNGSIAILSRYNYLLGNARDKLKDKQLLHGVNFWTFHKSKGLEADYCILVGFFQGKTGFPNENKGLFLVEAILPTLDSFPHSEERRLLYVGLTRAKEKSYLIADPRGPSTFINELLSPKYRLHIVSDTFKNRYKAIFKCPKCEHGFLRLLNGKHGPFYRCTTGLGCKVKPRVCPLCDSPAIDGWSKSVCNNPDCSGQIPICDKCGRPMRKRQGKYGEFWGCSGYGIKEDSCRNTRKFFA